MARILEGKYEAKLVFTEGWRVQTKTYSVGGLLVMESFVLEISYLLQNCTVKTLRC